MTTATPHDASATPAAGAVKASVILPVYNRRYFAGLLLDHLAVQTLPCDQWEVIVVDDGSTDDTASVVEEKRRAFPAMNIVYHWQPNAGAAGARNTGIRLSTAPIVCVIDSDAMPAPDWLEEILKGYDDDPLLAGVGGRIHTHQSAGLINEYNLYKKFNEVPGGHGGGAITFLMTGNLSHRRDVLLQVGGFNPHYPHFGDDNELGERVRLLGYHYAYNERAEVDHYHRDTFATLLRRFYWLGHGCFDNEMDMASRLTNKSTHRFYFWITKGMFLKNVAGLLGALPARLRETRLPLSRRLAFFGLDLLVEGSVWLGVSHFYFSRFIAHPWDKSLYPDVYYAALGFQEVPCPVCGGERREKLFFIAAPGGGPVRYRVVRCLDCDEAYLSPRPPAGQGVAPVPSALTPDEQDRLVAEHGAVVTQWGSLCHRSVLEGRSLPDYLREVAADLPPGGAFLTETVNAAGYPWRWFRDQGDVQVPGTGAWPRPETLRRLFLEAGFQSVTFRSVSNAGSLKASFHRWWCNVTTGGGHPPQAAEVAALLKNGPPTAALALPPPAGGVWRLLARWLDARHAGERLVVIARK